MFPGLSTSATQSLGLNNAQLCRFGAKVSGSEIPFPGAHGPGLPETGSSSWRDLFESNELDLV